MSRRFKSPTMKFGVPLSVPGSRYVEHCYGKHGKGYGHTPPRNSDDRADPDQRATAALARRRLLP